MRKELAVEVPFFLSQDLLSFDRKVFERDGARHKCLKLRLCPYTGPHRRDVAFP
jgi:hypothetical protein